MYAYALGELSRALWTAMRQIRPILLFKVGQQSYRQALTHESGSGPVTRDPSGRKAKSMISGAKDFSWSVSEDYRPSFLRLQRSFADTTSRRFKPLSRGSQVLISKAWNSNPVAGGWNRLSAFEKVQRNTLWR